MPFSDLQRLRTSMRKGVFTVLPILFTFREDNYWAFVELYGEKEEIPPYVLVKVTFSKENDLSDYISGAANSKWLRGFDIGAFREFFGIDPGMYWGDVTNLVRDALDPRMPITVPEQLTNREVHAAVSRLCTRNSEDPNLIFLKAIKRNPMGRHGLRGRRSSFNSEKTARLRPIVFEHFKRDPHISFVYSADAIEEASDMELMNGLIKDGVLGEGV